MKSKLTRMIARLLIVAMLVALAPAGAFANDAGGDKATTEKSAYLVKYKTPQSGGAGVFRALGDAAVELPDETNVKTLDLTPAEAAELAWQDDVELVEPDYEVEAMSADAVTWGVDAVMGTRPHSFGVTGRG